MTYDYYRRVLCPFCGFGEMRAVNASLARCSECKDSMSHSFYDTLLQIRALPDAEGQHACGCGRPETRAQPGVVSRCPDCGAEVAPRSKP